MCVKFAFLINLISWPMNTFPCKADAGITNEPKQKGLKIPLSVGLAVCSVHVLWLVQTSLLCWALGSFHIQPSVWSGGVAAATEKSLCHLSGRLLLFVEKKRDGTKWARGGYLLLANRHCPQRWSSQLPLWPDSWLSSLIGAAVFAHNASCS